LRSLSIPYLRLLEGVASVADMASSEQRILPARRVRKPSDCLVPCLASKLVHQFYAVGGLGSNDYTSRQDTSGTWSRVFTSLSELCYARGRRSGETRRVGRAKAFDKGESEAVYALRG
jgi:hypothetical protein